MECTQPDHTKSDFEIYSRKDKFIVFQWIEILTNLFYVTRGIYKTTQIKPVMKAYKKKCPRQRFISKVV